jgi:hypothetical protein
MHLGEGPDHRGRHQFVEHIVVIIYILNALVKELISRLLVEVVVQPGEPETAEAVADQVKKRFNVIVGVH